MPLETDYSPTPINSHEEALSLIGAQLHWLANRMAESPLVGELRALADFATDAAMYDEEV